MIRAFLAVQLPVPLRESLAAIQSDVKRGMVHDLPREASLSWVRPASLHLTVKFLGDIDEGLVVRLGDAMTDTLRHHRAIRIPLDRLGVFPRLQQPRILWIGPSDGW